MNQQKYKELKKKVDSVEKHESNFAITFVSNTSTDQVWNIISSNVNDGAEIRVGILDSSFNPPTNAHLQLLLVAAAQFHLDTYLLLLSTKNADKELHGASMIDRLMMMEIVARIAAKYKIDNSISPPQLSLPLPASSSSSSAAAASSSLVPLFTDNLAVALTDSALFVDKVCAIDDYLKKNKKKLSYLIILFWVTTL